VQPLAPSIDVYVNTTREFQAVFLGQLERMGRVTFFEIKKRAKKQALYYFN